jgi:hypothetical protein
MISNKRKEIKRIKKLNRRKKFVAHRNRNPKDTPQYRAFKQAQKEAITKLQLDQIERDKQDKQFGNKVKKFFNKFVPKLMPRKSYNRGK